MWVNDARLTNSRKTDSARTGGEDGVASSVEEVGDGAACMLNSNDGTIFSMCCLSQMFSTKSSDTVLRITPWIPRMPAIRIESRNSMLSWFPWHIEENLEMKKSYRRWYDGVSSSMFANRTNWNGGVISLSIGFVFTSAVEYFTHRICGQNLEIRITIFQEFLDHPQKGLDEQIQCLSMARHQQQVHSLHCNFHKPNFTKMIISKVKIFFIHTSLKAII